MPFYLSDLFYQTTGGVCLSARLLYCLSMHALQASLYVSPPVSVLALCVYVPACAHAAQSLGEL